MMPSNDEDGNLYLRLHLNPQRSPTFWSAPTLVALVIALAVLSVSWVFA